MWASVVVLLLVGVLPTCPDDAPYNEYYQRDPALFYEEEGDFYAIYGETDTVATLLTDPTTIAFTRKRRYGQHTKPMDPDQLRYVQGALKEVMAGRDLDIQIFGSSENLNESFAIPPSRTPASRKLSALRSPSTNFSISPGDFGNFSISPGGFGNMSITTPKGFGNMSFTTPKGFGNMSFTTPKGFGNMSITTPKGFGNMSITTPKGIWNMSFTTPKEIANWTNITSLSYPGSSTTGSSVGTETITYKRGKAPFPPGPKYDINAIIAIIANLTYDYEWNLTEEFNKTLIDHGVPTCPTASTLSTTSTTPSPYDFANTSVVGKCFVCGLKTPEIPRDAACADAFAGDFLPLVPVDARARGQIASYRKYCRHLDVHNYVENPSEPRSIYGRFTGGCGVRWTDMTGIYTQRTCRARFRPLMGKHFASKRMAKLELALLNVENGCIISPMATLLPLSRGVSLYARFHACVCTGSWCNRAPPRRSPAAALPLLPLLLLLLLPPACPPTYR